MSNDDDLQELREQTQRGSRLGDETAANTNEFVGDLSAALADLDDNDNIISIHDGQFAALWDTLKEHDQRRETLVAALEQERGQDVSDTRSNVLRELVRVGMAQVAPDLEDDLREAVRENIDI